MTWLMWRQHRGQLSVAAIALAAFAVLLLVTGVQIASEYQQALLTCASTNSCATLANTLTLGSPILFTLVTLTAAAPALLGLFWGAPLVSREVETGTSEYVWTQSISRRHWLTVKTGWLVLATAACTASVAALVTWWSGPNNSLKQNRFEPSQFDIQGIVPVGYALFAVALGLCAGTLLRRTLPALAVTLVAFGAARILTEYYLRPRYIAPITRTFPLGSPVFPAGSFWSLDQGSITPDGQTHSGGLLKGPLSQVPTACQALVGQDAGPRRLVSCLGAHGYKGYITYQPADRYWTFQGIETGIFIALAATLITLTVAAVLHRDA